MTKNTTTKQKTQRQIKKHNGKSENTTANQKGGIYSIFSDQTISGRLIYCGQHTRLLQSLFQVINWRDHKGILPDFKVKGEKKKKKNIVSKYSKIHVLLN